MIVLPVDNRLISDSLSTDLNQNKNCLFNDCVLSSALSSLWLPSLMYCYYYGVVHNIVYSYQF